MTAIAPARRGCAHIDVAEIPGLGKNLTGFDETKVVPARHGALHRTGLTLPQEHFYMAGDVRMGWGHCRSCKCRGFLSNNPPNDKCRERGCGHHWSQHE